MIDELITALEKLQEAKAEYREAAKNCQYDRGYFCKEKKKQLTKQKKNWQEYSKVRFLPL